MNMAEESGALEKEENNTHVAEYEKWRNAGEDLFWSESNLEHLRRGIVALNAGDGREHEFIEAEMEG